MLKITAGRGSNTEQSAMNGQPLLFLQFLAGKTLEPCGLLLDLGEGDVATILPLLKNSGFPELTRTLPCVIEPAVLERSVTDLFAVLFDAGCSMLPPGLVCRPLGQRPPVLAEGKTLLQGEWYLGPAPFYPGRQPASRALSLKLLQLVATDADTHDIESVFRQDPVLAYHLLRLVNSLAVGVGRRITSFSQAILILGRQQLKRWLNLMLFAASRDDIRSAMLLARASLRAQRMELIAKSCGHDRLVQEQSFMAGMFSLLGILFGVPLAELLKPLRLNEHLSAALLGGEGEIGLILKLVDRLEQGLLQRPEELLGQIGLDNESINAITIESFCWTVAVIHDKQEPCDA